MANIYSGISVQDATKIQNELRSEIVLDKRYQKLETIAGADISLNLYSTIIYAGIVHLSFPSLRPIGYSLVQSETRFPYVPGYLAFREVPALLEVWEQMTNKPDVLVIDGHGIAHPRRLGIAAHFGAITKQTSMGCAKKILFGKFQEPDIFQGSSSPIYDRQEVIGYAFRSKTKTLPVYVSPGYGMTVENSLEIIRSCTGIYRIPEPTRLAHELVNKFRRGELKAGYHEL